MGAQARAFGRGGITRVARLLEVNPSTVSKGLLELSVENQFKHRVRRPGAGRKRLTVSDPGVTEALMRLMKPVGARIDQPVPLHWTTLSTRRLATELTSQGHRISAWTVTNLLSEAGFSIQTSPGRLTAAKRSGYDAQFARVSEQVTAHLSAGQPVIILGCGKREPAEKSADGRDGPAPDTATSPDRWAWVPPDWHTMCFALATIQAWGMRLWGPRHDVHRLLVVEENREATRVGAALVTSELSGQPTGTGLRVDQCRLPPGIVRWNKVEDQVTADCSVLHHDGHRTRHIVNLKLIVRY